MVIHTPFRDLIFCVYDSVSSDYAKSVGPRREKNIFRVFLYLLGNCFSKSLLLSSRQGPSIERFKAAYVAPDLFDSIPEIGHCSVSLSIVSQGSVAASWSI